MELTKDIQITSEFENALKLIDEGYSLFITGKAGTGKSTLIELIKKKAMKPFVVLAPTGVAALNVEGMTIHSFFRLPLGVIDVVKLANNMNEELARQTDLFIIDEVSMVRADTMDAIDSSLKYACGNRRPFGGKQMIFVGDNYQLPPVLERDKVALGFLEDNYSTQFWFSAPAINREDFKMKMIELTRIFRQEDKEFTDILNAIREDDKAHVALRSLRALVRDTTTPPEGYVYLASTNRTVDEINRRKLEELEEPALKIYPMRTGIFPQSMEPTDNPLVLKQGAQVMCLVNNVQEGYVNGDVGTVKKIDQRCDVVEVELQNETLVRVNKYTWKNYKYGISPDNSGSNRLRKESIGSLTQFPLRLAWAITIHKAQGKTFDKAVVDMGYGAFDTGQTYVALSRLRSMGGLILTRALRPSDVQTSEAVGEFLQRMRAR